MYSYAHMFVCIPSNVLFSDFEKNIAPISNSLHLIGINTSVGYKSVGTVGAGVEGCPSQEFCQVNKIH